MPPKQRFSRQQIVDAAFYIAEHEGIDQITMRKVAKQLKSSVAPIYVNFTDIEQLKQAVFAEIVVTSQRLLNERKTNQPFRDIGIASLNFAQRYPLLFNDFVLKQNNYLSSFDQNMWPTLINQMKTDPALVSLSEEALAHLLMNMRIFQLGLSIMTANQLLPQEWDDKQTTDRLDEAASAFIKALDTNKGK
ncbi:transcriptional regulator, TetR family [Amphibacillus marinus]|uniref:Transcriptional regulator, TetR family n=1 Tax=Amphibacillus marinus TaxID=872970 RepID=A0A1H8KDI0_9BACI|nr:TetR/AcrR family transcriptional regulator [Amphibacillus marinus]SEN90905.1 transcriptional regulator, TetR family [Amphibacillus marinus]